MLFGAGLLKWWGVTFVPADGRVFAGPYMSSQLLAVTWNAAHGAYSVAGHDTSGVVSDPNNAVKKWKGVLTVGTKVAGSGGGGWARSGAALVSISVL